MQAYVLRHIHELQFVPYIGLLYKKNTENKILFSVFFIHQRTHLSIIFSSFLLLNGELPHRVSFGLMIAS